MKNVICLLLILCAAVSLCACGVDANPEGETQQPAESGALENQPSDERLNIFNKNASLDETILVDEGGVKITAAGLKYTDYSVELELTIENNSGKDLSFVSGSMGYNCNAINGYMVKDGYLNCDIADGKKANDSISFSYDGLMLYGIHEIADIEIGFDMSDGEYNHTYSGPRQLKTSAFDTHDYDKNYYQETITSRAAMNTYGYDISCFSQDSLYDENGVKVLSSGVMVNRDGETALLLELENTTSSMVYVATSNIAINGLVADSSTWSSDAIGPGKHGIVDVELSSVLDSEYWSVYGIEEVGSISLSLSQYDPDGNKIADETAIEVVVPGAKAAYDASGQEVYNSSGLRIAAKTILEDEYGSDMSVLLLAENHSGKTLSINDVYDSLSVNGFMTEYSYYSKELADGDCAVLELELWESSLEENKIASVSDIKEVEMKFEIKEGYHTIDEPVIKITFD